MTMTPDLARTLAFLRDIGLPVVVKSTLSSPGFLDCVRIEQGGLCVQPDARVSDVLHEAGHLAVTPARFRALVQDDVDEGHRRMFEAMEAEKIEVDSPLWRAALQSGEAEATAWTWAAGLHLGLAPERIIENDDYDGEGAFIRQALAMESYLGINGLCHAGFCGRGELGRRRRLPLYPQLCFWLQGGPAMELENTGISSREMGSPVSEQREPGPRTSSQKRIP